jgi:hypothetical protein
MSDGKPAFRPQLRLRLGSQRETTAGVCEIPGKVTIQTIELVAGPSVEAEKPRSLQPPHSDSGGLASEWNASPSCVTQASSTMKSSRRLGQAFELVLQGLCKGSPGLEAALLWLGVGKIPGSIVLAASTGLHKGVPALPWSAGTWTPGHCG